MEEPDIFPHVNAASSSSPVVNVIEEGTVDTSFLGPRREIVQLPARVNNTILEARTPSTR